MVNNGSFPAGRLKTGYLPETVSDDANAVSQSTLYRYVAARRNGPVPHTIVACALFKGTDKTTILDRKDFEDDIISNIDGGFGTP